MFRSLLIANRGEIACRIIGTARRLGLRTIAVYSDADAHARHVRLADEALRLGPAPARESYLDVGKVIAAAQASGAEAIHPGYGFLSENAALAEACVAAGIIFVGPTAHAIRAMGSKSAAKALMAKADVPLTPGYHGDDQAPAKLAAEAQRIGFPVLIKAAMGGGGKGMRRVDRAQDFDAALASCRREATQAFGNDQVLVEKYIERPRHIEVQVFGDTHGNYVHLFERDCSVQRRHQKVLEEAPAPGMTDERRQRMGQMAILAAKAVDYVGAGTVEFIADPSGTFYFMEMNTRLQVEHPVTEKVTGLDLVEWQLRVAAGEPLPKKQNELTLHGHAIEARIYAENPDAGFLPQTGRLQTWQLPPSSDSVRIDSGVDHGDEVTANYDPMLAKLITWGADRDTALTEMVRALGQLHIVGVGNNVEFLRRLALTKSFATADLDTSLIEREHDALQPPAGALPDDVWLAATAVELWDDTVRDEGERDPESPWARCDGWRIGATAWQTVSLRQGETTREIAAQFIAPRHYRVRLDANAAPIELRFQSTRNGLQLAIGDRTLHAQVVPAEGRWHVFAHGRHFQIDRVDPLHVEASDDDRGGGLRAPMPGRVVAHLVAPGADVAKGAPLMLLEAMKMELTVYAPRAGRIASFRFAPGDQVSEGAELVTFEEPAKP